MVEVFIALVGGICSAGKILADASELNNSKQISDCYMNRLSVWKQQVVDRALEEDLRDYITKHENRESVWAEIREVYQKMCFQKNYTSANDWVLDGAADKTKAGRERYKHRRFDEPLDILLAKHGKLRNDKSSLSIAHLCCGEGQRTRADWDRTVEFWSYIRDELRKHGVDAQLLFQAGYTTGAMKAQYFDVDKVETFRYQHGNLVWLPDTMIGL